MRNMLKMTVVAACLCLAGFSQTGCALFRNDVGAEAKAFLTLKETQALVDKAMNVYGTAVVTGKVSTEKQKEIDEVHAKYRFAFREAVTVARGGLGTLTPANVSELANQLQLLITYL